MSKHIEHTIKPGDAVMCYIGKEGGIWTTFPLGVVRAIEGNAILINGTDGKPSELSLMLVNMKPPKAVKRKAK